MNVFNVKASMTTVEFANYTGGEVGDIITISDRQGYPMYTYTEDHKWVELSSTKDLVPGSKCITGELDSTENLIPRSKCITGCIDVLNSPKVVYETLKVQGFSCPNCGSTEFEEMDNTKIRCKYCTSMFNCKLESIKK